MLLWVRRHSRCFAKLCPRQWVRFRATCKVLAGDSPQNNCAITNANREWNTFFTHNFKHMIGSEFLDSSYARQAECHHLPVSMGGAQSTSENRKRAGTPDNRAGARPLSRSPHACRCTEQTGGSRVGGRSRACGGGQLCLCLASRIATAVGAACRGAGTD